MKLTRIDMPQAERAASLKSWINDKNGRLGLITSIDGSQLVLLALEPGKGTAFLWETHLDGDRYRSLTPVLPQCHWFERTIWDMFALYPDGHPRLKHNLLHEPYHPELAPLRRTHSSQQLPDHRNYEFLEVKGDGIYEIPVGPIHAGIIEPGHFRFSCLGEIILNLEIRLGYVHRGIERRLTEVEWTKTRFLVEAAASDAAAANALAHATALESLLELEVPPRAQYLRTLALEIERIAMHIGDIGGIAGDIGFLAISASMSRLRGDALRLGELLTGSRFQRAFICPGGTVHDPAQNLEQIRKLAFKLQKDLLPVTEMFLDNPVARDRMEKIGRVSPRLASAFGLVGVGGRASNIHYDCRQHFSHGVYPAGAPPIACEMRGDVFSRTRVRVTEIDHSFKLIDQLIDSLPSGSFSAKPPENLLANRIGLGIVEAHRGELIHLVFTDDQGSISRYAIKDPSVNNWTGLVIAVRNNLVADFPLCNKSFSLSYSGHDL